VTQAAWIAWAFGVVWAATWVLVGILAGSIGYAVWWDRLWGFSWGERILLSLAGVIVLADAVVAGGYAVHWAHRILGDLGGHR
jgi:hypothetical protein